MLGWRSWVLNVCVCISERDRRSVKYLIRLDLPRLASQANTVPLKSRTAGAKSWSRSAIIFHCFASKGAGASRSDGVARKDCEKVWPFVLDTALALARVKSPILVT